MSPRSTETEVLAQELDSVGNKLRALEARLTEVEKIIEGLEAAALTTARALEEGQIDGFWANAMGGETAVRRGVGKILVDVRRGDDPADVRHFTFAGLATTEAQIARNAESVGAAVRAIVKTQKALRDDPTLAAEVGRRKFPKEAAELITTIVERDLPFYDPVIYEEAIAGLNRFAQSIGHLHGPVPYEQVVAVRFCDLWRS